MDTRHGLFSFIRVALYAVLLPGFGLFFLLSCHSPENKNNNPSSTTGTEDPLPSWIEGNTKKAIMDYVRAVTTKGSSDFIPEAERIATFDNDGCLWSEQPMYFQFFFAIDRVKAMAADHPEWKTTQPFKAILDNDMEALMKQGEKGILEVVMATHAGMTTDAFDSIVKEWVATAMHPTKHHHFTELVFQPMLELLAYLRDNNFKTFIVSGGGIDFMRPWTEQVYGIPKDQVVGSTIKVKYDYQDGHPVIHKLAELDFIDDKNGKPECIQKYIGRKPVFAAGNSDGDLQMLRWTDANPYKSFKLYVHHTDADREWAYDRSSAVGRLDAGLDEANQKRWVIADMAKDWKVIYPFEMK
jgi:phosphoserine phosphatase